MKGMEDMVFEMKPIGFINSPFKSMENTPIQPSEAFPARGSVVLKHEYRQGLKDLDGFSHIELFYVFHEAAGKEEVQLIRKPFLDDQPHGIFAIRHYSRPNPIGHSVVKLLAVKDNSLEVEGIDVVDGTPLLDIKPYVPGFHAPGPVAVGWLEKRTPGQRD